MEKNIEEPGLIQVLRGIKNDLGQDLAIPGSSPKGRGLDPYSGHRGIFQYPEEYVKSALAFQQNKLPATIKNLDNEGIYC